MSSKARLRLQRLTVTAVAVCAAVLSGAAQTMPDGRPTPSGQPVPRWLSLKSSEVHARFGPGLDHRILWEYRVSGVAWVHRSVVSSRRSVFNASAEEVPIHAGRSETSAVRARLSPRSLVAMDECEEGWCRVRAGRLRGWVRQSAVFGTQEQPLCNAARSAVTGRR